MSKYEDWTLIRLKDELKRRKAKLSGKKADLIERLQSYDRNFNFDTVQDLQPEYKIDLPGPGFYKDINSESNIDGIAFELSNLYLKEFDKIVDSKGHRLVDAKFLKYIRWAFLPTKKMFFYRSDCCAEMKKIVSYVVDISTDNNGSVVEAQCECAAGMGPSAHCKHVCALLYALGKYSDNKSVLTKTTCTQELQSFHHVKRKTCSPVKAQDLPVCTANANNEIRKDPRKWYQKNEGYNGYLRSLSLNYTDDNLNVPHMPLTQMYAPANPYGIEHDHQYTSKPLTELFFNEIYKESDQVEKKTREQSKSILWQTKRTIRLTSSNFGKICKLTERADKVKLANSFTKIVKISAPTLNHGRKFESVAIKQFEKTKQVNVIKSGLFISNEYPFLAATPDGIIDDNTILEVKCPLTAYKKPIDTVTVPYLSLVNDQLTLKHSHDYYYQIQGQLAIAKRKVCHLVIWTQTDMKEIIVKKDDTFINEMFNKLEQFNKDYFERAILETYYYKKYYRYNFKD